MRRLHSSDLKLLILYSVMEDLLSEHLFGVAGQLAWLASAAWRRLRLLCPAGRRGGAWLSMAFGWRGAVAGMPGGVTVGLFLSACRRILCRLVFWLLRRGYSRLAWRVMSIWRINGVRGVMA